MKVKNYTGIVPEQHSGVEIIADASVDFANEDDAKSFYNVAKGRLLHVNQWHEVAGALSATFQAFNQHAAEVNGAVEEGFFMRIDIPGPGSPEGEGYDWVKIETVKEVSEGDVQSVGFRVRPTKNPQTPGEQIAHFYDEDSTSNFIVTREGKTITATIIDRNTKRNDDTETVADAIRDTSVAIFAIGFFSKAHWQSLAEGIVKIAD